MRIIQAHISASLQHFDPGFRQRWNLSPYVDRDSPALFVGIYNRVDVAKVDLHRGFKLVLFGGADCPNAMLLKKGFTIVVDEHTYNSSLRMYLDQEQRQRVRKFVRVPWKDYSDFKPMPLGDKIYSYQSNQTENAKTKYRYDMLESVMKHFGEDMVLVGYHGNSMDTMVKEFYSKSFVNLQFNSIAGFTSALEMAHLGRVSVSNYPAPFCIPWGNDDDVIRIIDNVMTNRITADPSGFLHDSSDWLTTGFWS